MDTAKPKKHKHKWDVNEYAKYRHCLDCGKWHDMKHPKTLPVDDLSKLYEKREKLDFEARKKEIEFLGDEADRMERMLINNSEFTVNRIYPPIECFHEGKRRTLRPESIGWSYGAYGRTLTVKGLMDEV